MQLLTRCLPRPVMYVASPTGAMRHCDATDTRHTMYKEEANVGAQINWRMRVTLNDGRAMTGQMLAFDKVIPSTLKATCSLC